MDNASPSVALPKAAFEQGNAMSGNAFDAVVRQQQAGCLVRLATGCSTEEAPINIAVLNPFRAWPQVGAKQANTDVINV